MFASNQQFRTQNPKLFFIDKALPKGNISERGATPVLDCWFNPKGNAAYTNIFEMNQKNECVTQDNSVPVTPAQAALLNYLDAQTLEQVINSLQIVQENSLYYCDPDLVHLPANRQVHVLLGHLSNLKN